MSVFDQLVKSLNSGERRELLEKIRSAFSVSEKPLYGGRNDPLPSVNIEEELARLGLFKRFILYLRSLVTNKDRAALMRDTMLKDLKRQLGHQAGGLMNFFHSQFTEKMFSELSSLMDGVTFFKNPLGQALRKEKGDFYAYLAGTELKTIQGRLESEIRLFNAEDETFDESVSKAEMLEKFETIIEEIPQEEKNRVYKDTQALYFLFHLSNHSFDKMLSFFRTDKEGLNRFCDFQAITRNLIRLADRLSAAKNSPSSDALRVLFLFSNKDRLDDEGFDLEEQITRSLSKAEEALTAIRHFNDRVPLPMIIRYITRNLDYTPKHLGGGEDWFVIFKEFWQQRIEWSYREFQKNRRKLNLIKGATDFLHTDGLPLLDCYSSRAFREDEVIRYTLSAMFLKGFMEKVFSRMYKPLELILRQGQFYKQQNRQEFAETFENIIELGKKVSGLEKQLDVTGYFGSKIVEIRKSMVNLKIKAPQIEEILSDANSDTLALMDMAIKLLQKLVLLLGGILHGEPGARFDTISNLATLGGRDNRLLNSSWENALKSSSQAANILRDLRDLESG